MLLDFASLSHYDWLDVPLWVFDPRAAAQPVGPTLPPCASGMPTALRNSCRATFSEHGDAVSERLAVTAADHAQGKIVRELWTLYPKGEPTSVMLVSRGMRTPDRRQVMLFAADSLGGWRRPVHAARLWRHCSTRPRASPSSRWRVASC